MGSLIGRSSNIYYKCFSDKVPFFTWICVAYLVCAYNSSPLTPSVQTFRRGSQAAIQNQVFFWLSPLQSKRRMWVSPLVFCIDLRPTGPLFSRLQPAWSLKLNTVVSLCFIFVVCLVWESSSQTVVGVWRCDYLSGTQPKEESYVRWWYLCLWSWFWLVCFVVRWLVIKTQKLQWCQTFFRAFFTIATAGSLSLVFSIFIRSA